MDITQPDFSRAVARLTSEARFPEAKKLRESFNQSNGDPMLAPKWLVDLAISKMEKSMAKYFDESKHPRDDHGRFGSGNGVEEWQRTLNATADLGLERAGRRRYFEIVGQANKEAQKKFESSFRMTTPLTSFEEDALRAYTQQAHMSGSAESINLALRNDLGDKASNGVMQGIDQIDKAMARSITTEPMTTFRGVKFDLGLGVGETFTDKGYVATSLTDHIAEVFAGNTERSMVEIKIPEGSNALPNNRDKEAEVILPRGSTFVVDDIQKNYDKFGRETLYKMSLVNTAKGIMGKGLVEKENGETGGRFAWSPSDIEITEKTEKSLAKEWDESKHPRGAGGRFGSGGGDTMVRERPTAGSQGASQPEHLAFIGGQVKKFREAGGTVEILDERTTPKALDAVREDTGNQADAISERYEEIIQQGNAISNPDGQAAMYHQAHRLVEGVDYMDDAANGENVLVAKDAEGNVCAAMNFEKVYDNNNLDPNASEMQSLYVAQLGSNQTTPGAATALQYLLATVAVSNHVGVSSEATPDARPYHEMIGRTMGESYAGYGGTSTWDLDQCKEIANMSLAKMLKARPGVKVDARNQPNPGDLDEVNPIWETKVGQELLADIMSHNKENAAAKSWDESKHPRGAGGRFGEGSGDQQNALVDSSGKVTPNGWDEWAYESANINDALRGVDPTTDSEGNRLGPKEVEEYKKLANAIQEEASSTKLPFNEVWRGDSFDSAQELYDRYGNGKTASDDVVSTRIELGGITSSSPDRGVADEYRATEVSGPVSCLVCFFNPNGVVGTMTFPSITDTGVPWQKQSLSDLKMGESVLPEGAKYSARIYPPDTQTPYGTFDHYFVEAYSAAKSLAKEWDESKHPRDAHGRFGSGGGIDMGSVVVLGTHDPIGARDYVAKYGTQFKGQKLPEGFAMGQPKNCFENASRIVMDSNFGRGGKLNYCEGVCESKDMPGLGFLHAWAVDQKGNVIDNTLKNPENYNYTGVTYNWDEYSQHIADKGYFGVLGGDWRDAMSVIHDGGINK